MRKAAWLVVALAVYFALVAPTLGHQGDGWDEQTDSWVATSLHEDWLCGKSVDPTQMRLQMYAGSFFLNSTDYDDSPIRPGRVLAMFYGAVGICGAWTYGHMLGGRRAANVAAWVLSLSPYYLSYARLSYTESDMLLCALVPFLAVSFTLLVRRGTLGAGVLAALFLGLCVATKFTCIMFLPPLLVGIFAVRRNESYNADAIPLSRLRLLPFVLLTALFVLLFVFGYQLPKVGWHGSLRDTLLAMAHAYGELPRRWKLWHYALTLIIAAGFIIWGVVNRRESASRFLSTVLVCVVSAVVFFAVCPAHTANPDTLASLFDRASGDTGPGLGGYLERASVMLLSIVFKDGILVGIALLAAPISRLIRLGPRDEGAFAVFTFAFYMSALMRVGFAQIFYILSMLTLLAPVLGGELAHYWSRAPKKTLCTAVAAGLWLVMDIFRCVPDYNLSAYPYLGARYLLGHSTIGYTGIVTIPNDGSSQVLDWLQENAQAGSKAMVFLPGTTEWAHAHRPGIQRTFTQFNGTDEKHPHDLSGCDYVATQIYFDIEESIGPEWPEGGSPVFTYEWYDRAYLESHFERVFSVRRAFGIETAAVWKRK